MKTGSESDCRVGLDASQREALFGARWIWWCAWFPFLPPLIRCFFVPAQPSDPVLAQERWLEITIAVMYWASMIGWIVLVPLAYFIRNQTYKSNWQGDTVSPEGYERANTQLFLILEVPCILGYLAYELTAEPGDVLVPLAVTAIFLLVNFPTGKAMRPTPPRLGTPVA